MSDFPRATYRLQLHPGFTFDDAADLSGYFEALGISHLYFSPYLQAASGSTHGYDVVDPGRVNQDLGGADGHERLCSALRKHQLGQILDVVPNHMAIARSENAWWWDVLENGPSSPYAEYFDVDWDPPENRLSNIILLPVLGDRYGHCVDRGEIQLSHKDGHFLINYFEHRFPVAPRSLADVLDRAASRSGSDQLAFIADSLRQLPLPSATDRHSTLRRHRNKEVLRSQLLRLLEESDSAAAALEEVIQEINSSPDLLDMLLEEQNFRLAYWRTAARDLGYRRFFDINTLVGLSIEVDKVFADTHRLVLQWLSEGVLDGLRIDHPDGLRDPEEYLHRLRETAPSAWIVVEKILHPGEHLPATWPVQGTTGYDFLNLVGGLFVNQAAEELFTDFYGDFTGQETDFHAVVREKKRQVVNELLAGDIGRLTELVMQLCERYRHYRDYTRYEVTLALSELVACLPVYRSYVRPKAGEVRDEDRRIITEAVGAAKSFQLEINPDLFDFIGSLLLLENQGAQETEFLLRFQQITGPIAAKGVEDTAFYCFNRFAGLNEVGGDPSRFGVSPEEFHRSMNEAATRRPHSMLATSTHDTKRSEDVRSRLAVLSEIPEAWAKAVRCWSLLNEKHRVEGVPDRNEEYFLYQTLVGAWPIELDRVRDYMEKALREAKVHTSWNRPDDVYEQRVFSFVQAVLEDAEFRGSLEEFIAPLVEPGRINSLSQTLLKITAAGVPDFYQGTELWDLSLVDPDNRRPVDFELRRRLLDELESLSPETVMGRMDEGLPKLWIIHRALTFRKQHPDFFHGAEYEPLHIHGEMALHGLAFARNSAVVAFVPRLVVTLNREWGDTWIDLPAGTWRNVFTDDHLEGGKTQICCLLERFPLAFLWKES